MKFFKSPLCIAALVVFLGAIFGSIVLLQKAPSTPTTTDTPTTSTEATVPEMATVEMTPPQYEQRIENQNVKVSFVTEQNNVVSVQDVPLYEIVKEINPKNVNDSRIVSITAKGEHFGKMIDDIKLPGNELKVDKDKTLAELEKSIQGNSDLSNSVNVKVITKKIEVTPQTGTASKKMDTSKFTTLLANFKTTHPGHIDDAGRNVNLAIASKKINNYIVKPNEKFSFNKVVGERSRANGFKEAGVISNGKVIPGLGGGICQVSTTLYRAVLLSGAKINERHNHSIYDGIEYAQRGLDAAVAWGYKDFKFTNALDVPLLITSTSGEGWVEVSIFAEKKPFESIELCTRNEVKIPFKTTKRINSKLKDGEVRIVHPGVDGYTVEAYRTIVSADGKSKEERLSKDKYLTYNRIEERKN